MKSSRERASGTLGASRLDISTSHDRNPELFA
jgi:hypothetical protein